MNHLKRENIISQNEIWTSGGNNIRPSEKQWKAAGSCFVSQKSFLAPIANIKGLTVMFLLVVAPGLAQCFPVKASQGGNRTVQLFFCKIPGCAANVINVFCNDKLLFSHTHTTNCMGPPQPGAVCQHDGRAYVSIDTDGDCEFEGKDGYIETQKYTDQSNNFFSITAVTSSPVTTKGPQKDHAELGYTVVGVICGLIGPILIVSLSVFALFCKKRQNREKNQQPEGDSGVTEPLRVIQSLGETSERDTGGPGLDVGISTPQPDH